MFGKNRVWTPPECPGDLKGAVWGINGSVSLEYITPSVIDEYLCRPLSSAMDSARGPYHSTTHMHGSTVVRHNIRVCPAQRLMVGVSQHRGAQRVVGAHDTIPVEVQRVSARRGITGRPSDAGVLAQIRALRDVLVHKEAQAASCDGGRAYAEPKLGSLKQVVRANRSCMASMAISRRPHPERKMGGAPCAARSRPRPQ